MLTGCQRYQSWKMSRHLLKGFTFNRFSASLVTLRLLDVSRNILFLLSVSFFTLNQLSLWEFYRNFQIVCAVPFSITSILAAAAPLL
jgi:hypothetical protein